MVCYAAPPAVGVGAGGGSSSSTASSAPTTRRSSWFRMLKVAHAEDCVDWMCGGGCYLVSAFVLICAGVHGGSRHGTPSNRVVRTVSICSTATPCLASQSTVACGTGLSSFSPAPTTTISVVSYAACVRVYMSQPGHGTMRCRFAKPQPQQQTHHGRTDGRLDHQDGRQRLGRDVLHGPRAPEEAGVGEGEDGAPVVDVTDLEPPPVVPQQERPLLRLAVLRLWGRGSLGLLGAGAVSAWDGLDEVKALAVSWFIACQNVSHRQDVHALAQVGRHRRQPPHALGSAEHGLVACHIPHGPATTAAAAGCCSPAVFGVHGGTSAKSRSSTLPRSTGIH